MFEDKIWNMKNFQPCSRLIWFAFQTFWSTKYTGVTPARKLEKPCGYIPLVPGSGGPCFGDDGVIWLSLTTHPSLQHKFKICALTQFLREADRMMKGSEEVLSHNTSLSSLPRALKSHHDYKFSKQISKKKISQFANFYRLGSWVCKQWNDFLMAMWQ